MALTVTYCGVCGMPPDLCSFGPAYESCKPWLRANRPELIVDSAAPSAAAIGESATVGGGVGGGVSADGDDALAAPLAALALDGAGAAGGGTADAADSSAAPADEPKKKAKAPAAPRVTIEVAERARKKHVTTITGLEAYCPKLKDASSVRLLVSPHESRVLRICVWPTYAQ